MVGVFGALQRAESGEPAAWVFDGLHPFHAYDTGSVIPEGFDTYAALLHSSRIDLQPGQGPYRLDGQDVAALVSGLERTTPTPTKCWFCLWEGWGWLHASAGPVGPLGGGPQGWRDAFDEVERFVATVPRVGTRYRQYHLFSGPIDAALDFGRPTGCYDAPSLWWPDDRAWIVATEIDLSWSYVAGERSVIDEVTRAWRFPTRPVELDDPLTDDGPWATMA